MLSSLRIWGTATAAWHGHNMLSSSIIYVYQWLLVSCCLEEQLCILRGPIPVLVPWKLSEISVVMDVLQFILLPSQWHTYCVGLNGSIGSVPRCKTIGPLAPNQPLPEECIASLNLVLNRAHQWWYSRHQSSTVCACELHWEGSGATGCQF